MWISTELSKSATDKVLLNVFSQNSEFLNSIRHPTHLAWILNCTTALKGFR